MFKTIAEDVWVVDAEWVPDAETGRRLYGLPADMPEADVIRRMFEEGGASEEEPRPYLKTALCRVVSISAVKRKVTGHHPVELELKSLPAVGDGPLEEAELLRRFLEAVGKVQPQLVGYNIGNADIPILVQRALASGVVAPAFFKRPNKPWEGVDYFSPHSESVVDLMDVFGVRGRGSPSLRDLAAAAGVPGKLGVAGEQVVDLWLGRRFDDIVRYNEFDALTTYLLWLKAARMAGFVAEKAYQAEESRLEGLLGERIRSGHDHLAAWLGRWRELRQRAPAAHAG
jgi:predicted PolB exonuclease-like 3'-5' exonuclease